MKQVVGAAGCVTALAGVFFAFIIIPVSMLMAIQEQVPAGDALVAWALTEHDEIMDGMVRHSGAFVDAPEGRLWAGWWRVPWDSHQGAETFYSCGPLFILGTHTLSDGYYVLRGEGAGLHLHGGYDYASRGANPLLLAPMSGKVVWAEYTSDSTYGNMVAIENNGYQIYLGHLDDMSVVPGQIVQAGDEIGHVGNTGNSTGPHLHFEVRSAERDAPIDPSLIFLPGQSEPCDWGDPGAWR